MFPNVVFSILWSLYFLESFEFSESSWESVLRGLEDLVKGLMDFSEGL